MLNMFYCVMGCSSLTSADFTGFNTSNVTTMEGMFHYADQLSSLDLSMFDTSKVTSMALMFWDTSSLTSVNLSNVHRLSRQ